MKNSFVYKNDRPWPNPRLKHAAIVGHTTDATAKIWFRTAAPGDFILLLYPAESDPEQRIFKGFKAVPYSRLNTLPSHVQKIPFSVKDYRSDSTVVITVDNLSPLVEYCYALYGEENGVARILIGQDRVYRFRTLPAGASSHSFAFYSCHMPYQHSIFGGTNVVNMEMWSVFNEVLDRHRQQDLRFVIGGGDQVYADGVQTLDIWKYLNAVMTKNRNVLLPSKDEMVSWYRDIYRGYWGFSAVKDAFSSYPTYMIWDDHELKDGWGSDILKAKGRDDLYEIFNRSKVRKAKLSRGDCLELLDRMRQAAFQVYEEYQHSHNPDTPPGQYDYAISSGCYSVYFLDGRGRRDVNKGAMRILGPEQMRRFEAWLQQLDPAITKYVFVVTAVPVLHMMPVLVNADDSVLADMADLQDDLRDAWEHNKHNAERRALLKALFGAARRGLRVSILSGDVHTSAVFRMVDKDQGAVIYQLTSSAITYNKPRMLGWILGNTVPDEGKSEDGYRFERLALYTDSNFSVVRMDPVADEVTFQLYGKQKVAHPDSGKGKEDKPITHSIAKIKLDFSVRR
ncbi:MAG: alkaline phosphatase family protein [Gammaproteobacteria bacterium]|nr:alkaline phosphatase family protein [Gammaproteobacteria bacterium]